MATQNERRAETVRAIIDAATTLFGERGFAGTTIDDIAKEAGVAKGAVYHHFNAKEAIFEVVLEQTQQSLVGKVLKSAVKAGAREQQLAGIRAYLNAATQPSAGQIVLIDGPAVLGWERWREVDARHFGALVAAGLSRIFAEQSLVDRPIEPLVHLILGAITEAAMVCTRAKNRRQAIDDTMRGFEVLVGGLARANNTE